MKRGISFNGIEIFTFGTGENENKLRIFPPNSFKFRPNNNHIILDEVQECILDNFWYQFNHKREQKGYIKMSTTEDREYIERRPLYVIFEVKMPRIYISFEEVVTQKKDGKLDGEISWKKYTEIDEAMNQARKILGTNYFMEPAAKEYIQKFRIAQGIVIPETSSGLREDRMPKKGIYKECPNKGMDPMDGQYMDMKIAQKFEIMSPEWKKNIKEEIMIELKRELYNKFEEMKR
ncbi:hypothetical protein BS78_09G047500 [Paspalum vaginatum]|nr:hypothetical protein BS78_09G047500 [Paspalum vaginatum]